MSRVYRCDRCGAIGKINAEGPERFSALSCGPVNGCHIIDMHLCPHCTKKLEDFISDPNYMETVEEREDPEEVIGIGNAEKMGNLINKLTEALSEEGR